MMNTRLLTPLTTLILALLFFALVLVNNLLFSSVRLDLTENQVYSLSQGSHQVIEQIEEPINLYFFYSNKASKGMTTLRNYASRVQSMLEEYESAAGGKINLQVIDPEPFSEAEDQANQYGLTGASIGTGDAIYMGLAATNSVDEQKIIAFFDPQKESFLEYDLSKLIYQLSQPSKVKVALLTDISMSGSQNPMTGQMEPEWSIYTQLNQMYDVEKVDSQATALPAETDVLLVVHPQNLSEQLRYDLDQFLLSGGKMIAFVDPQHESSQNPMMPPGGANSSNLAELFQAWGVEFNPQQVVLDAQSGLEVRTPDGGVARHMGILGLGQGQLDTTDVTTSNLEVINGSSFGEFSLAQESELSMQPLLQTSPYTSLIGVTEYAMARDPQQFAQGFQDSGQVRSLAVRVSGSAKSSFAAPIEGMDADSFVNRTDNLNVILVADSDLLADRFWVQQANFFGQTIFTPFANNGDFFTNAVENMGGSDALISIRSRGTFARPFTVVDELTVIAEQKFREQEQLLQSQLEETEAQLSQLQSQQMEGNALVLSAEQEEAVNAFMQKKIEIRKALREVRHQLDKDIESLGNWLKFINVVLAPFCLMLLLFLFSRLFKTHSSKLVRRVS